MLTVVLAAAVCAAAYGFLGACGTMSADREHLIAQQVRLQIINAEQRQWTRKQKNLQQGLMFCERAAALGLERRHWAFYDVNVQGAFSFEAAQQIIHQCGDSTSAYYWPGSLEIKVFAAGDHLPGAKTPKETPGDVQLTVKGQFVARQPLKADRR